MNVRNWSHSPVRTSTSPSWMAPQQSWGTDVSVLYVSFHDLDAKPGSSPHMSCRCTPPLPTKILMHFVCSSQCQWNALSALSMSYMGGAHSMNCINAPCFVPCPTGVFSWQNSSAFTNNNRFPSSPPGHWSTKLCSYWLFADNTSV